MLSKTVTTMDLFWDVCYATGLTDTPSLASTPVLPEHCQRDITQYYKVDEEIIGSGSFGYIRRVQLLHTSNITCANSSSSSSSSGGDSVSRGESRDINDEIIIDEAKHKPAIINNLVESEDDHENNNTASTKNGNDRCYYACKTIPKSKLYDRELLRREVYNLNRCQKMTMMTTTSLTSNGSDSSISDNNNYIIRLLDVIEDRESIHIITELCEGGELYDYIVDEHKHTGRGLRGKCLSSVSSTIDDDKDDSDHDHDYEELRCATIIFQILTAFQFLHDDVNICHRDMKASNFVFVQKPSISITSLELRIIDFGLSKYVGKQNNNDDDQHHDNKIDNDNDINTDTNTDKDSNENDNDDIDNNKANTTINIDRRSNDDDGDNVDDGDEERLYSRHFRYMTSEVGTPYYVAPEVLTQQRYTTKCDIWSIGVLAYLTLTGTLPVMGKDEPETVHKLMNPNLEVDFKNKKLWYQEEEDVDNDDNNNNNNNNNQTTTTSNNKNKRGISRSAQDFCRALLQRDPKKRPTAQQALRLDWIVKHCGESNLESKSKSESQPVTDVMGVHHNHRSRHRRRRRRLPSLSAYT
jgi:serine/threonine protein kinase